MACWLIRRVTGKQETYKQHFYGEHGGWTESGDDARCFESKEDADKVIDLQPEGRYTAEDWS